MRRPAPSVLATCANSVIDGHSHQSQFSSIGKAAIMSNAAATDTSAANSQNGNVPEIRAPHDPQSCPHQAAPIEHGHHHRGGEANTSSNGSVASSSSTAPGSPSLLVTSRERNHCAARSRC